MDGYPTWEIGGKFYGGYQSLEQLATLSGFDARAKKRVAEAKKGGAANSLGIDFAAAPPAVRNGDDCELGSPEDCK